MSQRAPESPVRVPKITKGAKGPNGSLKALKTVKKSRNHQKTTSKLLNSRSIFLCQFRKRETQAASCKKSRSQNLYVSYVFCVVSTKKRSATAMLWMCAQSRTKCKWKLLLHFKIVEKTRTKQKTAHRLCMKLMSQLLYSGNTFQFWLPLLLQVKARIQRTHSTVAMGCMSGCNCIDVNDVAMSIARSSTTTKTTKDWQKRGKGANIRLLQSTTTLG